ncbi:hypothetical protein E8D34_12185 [Nocardioides sp. GY 10113]|uniref:ATP-grasp domain-containing protein n=1 Tax=Nocardioides sp. GY 10113 TaxID=2569761 RepID=UPI0010A7C0D4|nr:hypothetical protein [Nocardioides sp. GY 10113]TIC85861.1 hypothetical protein E8D34_12185 [Nocardioides sp. GY 10113]
MPDVLLATFALMPDGEPGGDLLPKALADRGITAEWVRWDDPDVDWAAADLVAVRSTWDYHRRLPAFLDWARRVERQTLLLNGAEVFAWNADKTYLAELAAASPGLPVIPTAPVDDETLVDGLGAAFARWGTVVVKPRTGAGGVGLVVADRLDDPRLDGLTPAPWVVQPLVADIRVLGETSVYVLDGRAVAQVDKAVAGEGAQDEVRVHEQYGGSSRVVAADPERARTAEAAVAAARELRGADLAYARVDLLPYDGVWAVSELELIEPGLYLDVDPANADRFADLVAARLR